MCHLSIKFPFTTTILTCAKRAQHPRTNTAVEMLRNIHPSSFLQSVMQVFTPACPNVRAIQKSLLLCDVVEPLLYVGIY